MAKKKKDYLKNALVSPLSADTLVEVKKRLDSDPFYSLAVDPTGELNMSKEAKDFTKWYIQHRNIPVAAQLAELDIDEAMLIYKSDKCQAEILRINNAMKMRQLNNNMLTVDQIGSMLTAFVMDQVPEADRLSTKDKMTALGQLLDINAKKQQILEEADDEEIIDVSDDVENLSVDAIKNLLNKSKSKDTENDEKERLINVIDEDSMLSNDDLKYLRSLSVADLRKLVKEQEIAKQKQAERAAVAGKVEIAEDNSKISAIKAQMNNAKKETKDEIISPKQIQDFEITMNEVVPEKTNDKPINLFNRSPSSLTRKTDDDDDDGGGVYGG